MSTFDRNDAPAVLLRACVFMLGVDRPEWGRAMWVELSHIDGRRNRWAFALGCVRCLAWTRPASVSQRMIRSCAGLAALGSMSVVAIAFIRFPGVVSGVSTWVATVMFAGLLSVYVVAAIGFGARLVDRRLILISALAGALIAGCWFAVALQPALGGPAASTLAVIGLGPLIALGLGWLATARTRSGRVGVGCTGLTALIAGFTLFLPWSGWTVAAGGRPYDAALLRDFKLSEFPDLATYAVNDSLGTGMVLLLLVPLLSALCGLAGVAAARVEWTHRRF